MTDSALHQGFAGYEAQKCQSVVNLLTDYHNTLKIPAESQGFHNETKRTQQHCLKLTGMDHHADLPERDTKFGVADTAVSETLENVEPWLCQLR